MIFLMAKRAMPKGVWTPEKAARLFSLKKFQLERAERIRDNFQKTDEARKQLRLMETSAQKISKLNALKPSERGAGHGKKLKLAYLNNATSYFSFLKCLLDFSQMQNAHPEFIKTIEHNLNLARENVIRFRNSDF